MSELSEGGGGQAYLGICPKFSRFFLVTPPLSQLPEENADSIKEAWAYCQSFLDGLHNRVAQNFKSIKI